MRFKGAKKSRVPGPCALYALGALCRPHRPRYNGLWIVCGWGGGDCVGGKVMRLISGSLTQFKAMPMAITKATCSYSSGSAMTKNLNWKRNRHRNSWTEVMTLLHSQRATKFRVYSCFLLNLFSFVCNSAKKEAANKCTERQKTKETNKP